MCEYCEEWSTKDLVDTRKRSYKKEAYPGIRAEVDVCVSLEKPSTINIYSVADTYEPSYQEAYFVINFCPMCGRDLRVKED